MKKRPICVHCGSKNVEAEIHPKSYMVQIFVYCKDCNFAEGIKCDGSEEEKDELIKKYEAIEL